jgi:hypothetical protein
MHYQFNGILTARDAKQHIAHPFTILDGMTELRLHFEYTPARVPGGLNALHLSLFDPHGFRGAGHRRGDRHESTESYTIALHQFGATPGYLAGPLPLGEWSVVIDSHMILPDAPISYQLVIDSSSEPIGAAAPATVVPARPALRGPGWYRGDLHAHTVHSDGAWQIHDLLVAAGAYGLDFVTLSDHNTVSGLAEFARQAPPDLLTIGGIELTTYRGHALALGLREWVDWRVRPGERSMPQIAAEVEAADGLFIIAHPMSVGDPICTGCDWRYSDMMPGPARLLEVWNGGEWTSESNNEDALALWYVWLNQGHRLVATAGTDAHGQAPSGVRPGFNNVYAEVFSESGILRAIAQGHVFLSDGPQLELSAQTANGVTAIMGDILPAERATISARWDGCNPSDLVRLVVNGQPFTEQIAGTQGEQQWGFTPKQARWCLIELREASGRLRAVTNPLFFSELQ